MVFSVVDVFLVLFFFFLVLFLVFLVVFVSLSLSLPLALLLRIICARLRVIRPRGLRLVVFFPDFCVPDRFGFFRGTRRTRLRFFPAVVPVLSFFAGAGFDEAELRSEPESAERAELLDSDVS